MAFRISIRLKHQKMVPYITIFCFLLFFAVTNCKGQQKKFKVIPTIGVSFRSTVMNFFNFKPVTPFDPTVPYPYEKNVQGLSIDPGMQLTNEKISLVYYAGLRYDVTHSDLQVEDKYYKEFILDHHFSLLLNKKFDYGVGLSIINFQKSFQFENPVNVLRYQNIQFNSFDLILGLPINKKSKIEFKVHYIPNGFPENPNEKYIAYSLRYYLKVPFRKKN